MAPDARPAIEPMTEGLHCRPFVLCILDGWGVSDSTDAHNAIFHARTPHWDRFQAEWGVRA